MGGRLVVQEWLEPSSGWHGSGSVGGMDHLTIKSAQLPKRNKTGEIERNRQDVVKRENLGHILPDGSIEDFGVSDRFVKAHGFAFPFLDWLSGKDNLAPAMQAIATFQDLKRQGHEDLVRNTRRSLTDEFRRNGIGGGY